MSSVMSLLILLQQVSNPADSSLFYKGYKEFLNNEWVNAEEYLLQHYELYPSSVYRAQVLYLLGEIKFKNEQYDKAIEYWSDLNKQYPESKYAIRGTLRMGDTYFNQKKYNAALMIYTAVKNLNPGEEILQEVGSKMHEALYYLGQYKSLIDALYHFINTNSDTTKSGGIIAKTMMRIARIHLEKKEYYSALVLLNRLQDTYPDSPIIAEALFERANTYKLLGDNQGYKKTLSLFITRKDTSDFYTYAVIELANLYFNEQQYDSSLHYWELLFKDNENYKDMALKKIAEIYNTIGQRYEAIIVIQSLINGFPQSKFIPDVYLLWAEILKNQGDFQQAIKILKELVEKVGSEPKILLAVGNIYFEIKDYDSALKIYLMASEAFKDQRDESARALILAGDAAYAMGDKNNARQYYLNARFIALSEEVKNLAMIKINHLD